MAAHILTALQEISQYDFNESRRWEQLDHALDYGAWGRLIETDDYDAFKLIIRGRQSGEYGSLWGAKICMNALLLVMLDKYRAKWIKYLCPSDYETWVKVQYNL